METVFRVQFAMQEMYIQSLGLEDPLEKGMAIYSSILAWKIPRKKEAWRATVHGVCKESDMTERLSTAQDNQTKRPHSITSNI